MLRHRPERAGIVLDPAGWVAIDDLLAGLARMGRPMSRARLEQLVARDGWVFRVSAYGVWLVDAVPPAYVSRQGPD